MNNSAFRRPSIRRRGLVAGIAVGTIVAASVAGFSSVSTAATTTSATTTAATTVQVLNPSPVWAHVINDRARTTWFGSPGVGTLDGGGPAVIVDDTAGNVAAYHVSNGSMVAGWPVKEKYQIQSTPSTARVHGTTRVFIGVGTSSNFRHGGYLALSSTGKIVWYKKPIGVMSSLAVGNLQGSTIDVVGGAMSPWQWAFNATTGVTLKGFKWFEADTNFSTPALANLYNTGHDYIIEGGDSTHGVAYGHTYTNGGHIRILSPNGRSGSSEPNGGLRCQYNTSQVVQSSPAVGGFLSGGANGVVVGTGTYWAGASDSKKIIAINTGCKVVWAKKIDGNSTPSPSIADVDGNGTLDVVAESSVGTVYALNGTNGATLWTRHLPNGIQGSISTFQSPTGNFQYLLAATTNGMYVIDGRNGDVVQEVQSGVQFRNTPTVTADPNGTLDVTTEGIQVSTGKTLVVHFAVNGTANETTAETYGAWPMFHHDPQLTGYAPYEKP